MLSVCYAKLGQVVQRLRDERGQRMVEYALILVLTAVVVIVSLSVVGTR